MRGITGTVVNGKVAVPTGVLDDGTTVAVLAPDSSAPVRLSRSREDELVASAEAIREGSFIDGLALAGELQGK